MSYRQQQQRNAAAFNALTKEQQQQARAMGYSNRGAVKVQNSWAILQEFVGTPAEEADEKFSSLREASPTSLEGFFSHGEVAVMVAQVELEAMLLLQDLREERDRLDANAQRLNAIADEALAKYPLL